MEQLEWKDDIPEVEEQQPVYTLSGNGDHWALEYSFPFEITCQTKTNIFGVDPCLELTKVKIKGSH